MRVAMFQRIFAHYQGGLVQALARSTEHEYNFFGDRRDPCNSGIEAYRFAEKMRYRYCTTWHLNHRLAWQCGAISAACSRQFDVLILEGSLSIVSNWFAIILGRAMGKRVLLYGHGSLRRDTGLKRLLKTVFYKLADGLLLYGKRGRDLEIQAGLRAERLYIVYNSLDEDTIRAQSGKVDDTTCRGLREELWGVRANSPVLLSVGRLTKVKRLNLLIEAAGLLNSRGIPVAVHVVGDGPEKVRLQQIAERLGVLVHFSGAVHGEQQLSVMISAADVMVIPGAAGLSVIHSLSYGTPVVTNDDLDNQMPEAEAIVPGENGLLFKAGDANSLADAIMGILSRLPRGEHTHQQCRRIIDSCYNPDRMSAAFDAAVAGRPACE
ncbi:MAG: glycosyltransferase [Nibricoccus sp.]